jgi:hypothetical protein
MDELDEKLRGILQYRLAMAGSEEDVDAELLVDIKQAFVKAGYIKLPNANNITISTSDNPNDKLMTREQWEKEVNG